MKEDATQVLIVDDETNLRESLAELVESEGFRSSQVANGEEAVRVLRTGAMRPDVVFLDMRMPKLDGLSVLRLIQEEKLTDAPVVVISAFGDSSKVIEAMRLGAYDYITKPLDLDETLIILHRAAEQRRLNREAEAMRQQGSTSESTKEAASPDQKFEMLGVSRAMRDIFKQIGRIAATDATLLITGESGTGKELVARAVHQHSARSRRPFVAVNCGALPENLIEAELFGHERGAFTGAERQKKGRFELAHTGTLFLDEVGELSLAAQVKLLRAVETRRFERVGGTESVSVDVRVVCATNRDLKEEVEEKRFREDLFYRLNVIEVRLPPLRERLADVPQLAESFLERAVVRHALKTKTLSPTALRELLAYDFPGNVRELENMIERAAVTSNGEVILPEHLFGGDRATDAASSQNADTKLFELPFHRAVAALERELIRRALRTANGNRAEAARLLGINRRLLYSKMEEHQIT
ncbi:MAG: two-component system, NtrC family, response regulator AtoC [Acidobacteriota bacterium]|jgi:two-component system response regulator AtoC|nr:two-component system, NtrC family, response regulator AtoC [Acidobacteriota bacterium]